MTDTEKCVCGKPVRTYSSYCSWDCSVDDARANGAVDYRPNGLPVKCMTASGLLLECEHGDHEDYVMPVMVEYIGKIDDHNREDFVVCTGRSCVDDEEVRRMYGERHAVIYCDGNVILTLNECSYSIWHASDGRSLGGFNEKKMWRIEPESLNRFMEVHRAKAKAKVPDGTSEETSSPQT